MLCSQCLNEDPSLWIDSATQVSMGYEWAGTIVKTRLHCLLMSWHVWTLFLWHGAISRSSPGGGKMITPCYWFSLALETGANKPLLLNYPVSASCNNWWEWCCSSSWIRKCPTEVHVDEQGVPASGVVLQGCGNFRLKSVARGSAQPGKTLSFITQQHFLSVLCFLTRDALWAATSGSWLVMASLPQQTVSPQTVRQFESLLPGLAFLR